MKKINSTLYLILTLVICITFFVGYFVMKPIAENIYSYYLQNNDAKERLTNIEKEVALLMTLRESKEEIEDQYNNISLFLPLKLDTTDFMIQLDTLTKNYNLTQEEINIPKNTVKTSASTSTDEKSTPNDTQTSTSLKENPYSLILNGSFSNLLLFLKDFEKMSRFTTINSLSISKLEDNQLSTKLNGTLYYKPKTTIGDNINSLTISTDEKKLINNLTHFGESLTTQSPDTINNYRIEPFSD